MIISASRRTDIPAYYSEWFFNRLAEGYIIVRNPINFNQVSKISLDRSVVDCFVFWTKNPEPMLKRLHELQNYNYYFQFTLTSYDKSIELNVPEKKEIIKTFKKLSSLIGKERVVWRYDPIMLTDKFTKDYHYKYFEYLCKHLSSYTERCVISYLDLYSKTQRNLKEIILQEMTQENINEISQRFSLIAGKYNIILETCAEGMDLSNYGISHSKCIDDRLISKIIGFNINIEKDPNQRIECGCIKSIDIGAYNTCKHNCLYCYANFNKTIVDNNVENHNSNSPLLFGDLTGNEKVTDREMVSYSQSQINFITDRVL